jgi:hypothetical protein
MLRHLLHHKLQTRKLQTGQEKAALLDVSAGTRITISK